MANLYTGSRLTESERWTVLNALHTAAETYRKDAENPAFQHDNEQCARIRTQLGHQADEALRLYEIIEEAEAIKFE